MIKIYGRWLSPGSPASSITKTDRHGIADLLLKVALNTINQIKKYILDIQNITSGSKFGKDKITGVRLMYF